MDNPTVVYLDYETFAAVPIGKKDGVGAFRYARDPSLQILMCSLAVGKEKPVVWVNPVLDVVASEYDQRRANQILAMLHRPDVLIYSHKAMFEIAVTDASFEKQTGYKAPHPHQFRCTMAMARRAALPPALGDLAKALNLHQQKDTKGTSLINKFCVPQKQKKLAPSNNPATLAKRAAKVFKPRIYPQDDLVAFQEFIEYCRQDTVVEQRVHESLSFFELKGNELATYLLDIDINMRGFPVNLKALRNAQKIIDDVEATTGEEFFQLTGLRHTQGAKVLAWLNERGWEGKNLQAETISAALGMEHDADESDEDDEGGAVDRKLWNSAKHRPEVYQCLLLKKRLSYAAIKKIKTMLAMAGPDDNHVRGTLVYHGAGPGRWAGSGVQPQNFKRPSLDLVKNTPWKEQGFKSEGKALADLTAKAYDDICNGATADMIELCYGPPLEVIASCIRHFIHDC